jgi:alpha-tubulin suppressor-like RCC1 family protein
MNVSSLILGNTYYLKVWKQSLIEESFFDFCLSASPAALSSHSLFLCSSGSVQSSGLNSYGQLGNGTTTPSTVPVTVSGITNAIAVAGGEDHSLALLGTGLVVAWGNNPVGQLGNGTTISSSVPVPVSLLTNVIAISVGNSYSLALKSDGTVWAWGSNLFGVLGDGTFTDHSIPAPVVGLSNIIAISAGNYHAMALKSDGTVWVWGNNGWGQLGDNTLLTRTIAVQEAVGFTNISAIAAGFNFSFIIDNAGNVFGTGDNSLAQLGNNTFTSSMLFIPSINVPSNMVSVSGGYYHALGVRNDGTVWGWGLNSYGELGNNTTISNLNVVQSIGITCAKEVDAGQNFSIATTFNGDVYTWGRGTYGVLADGSVVDKQIPNLISVCPAINPIVVAPVSTICVGSGATLTATGGTGSYFWSPATGLSSTTGATVIANPLTTTTYTVSGSTIPGCGTSATVTVTVDPTCCTGSFTVPSGGGLASVIGTSFSSTTLALNGNFTIDLNTTINSNTDVLCAPNTKIIILSGRTLTINKSRLFSCGLEMWDGIEIQPGGNLIITNKALIEDAKIAILSNNAGGIANFHIEKTELNRNYVGLKVINYTLGTLHPGKIINSDLDSKISVTTTSNTPFLDAPFSSQTAEYGVELNNVNYIEIGSSVLPSYLNKFRYLRIGIRSQASKYNAYNNDFRNNFTTPPCFTTFPPGLPCPIIGWAIWNTSSNATIGGYAVNQPNNFKDLSNGILHERGLNLNIYKNTFTNITTTSSFITSIAIYTKDFLQGVGVINIEDNDLKDLETGIKHQNNANVFYNVRNNEVKNFKNYGINGVQNQQGNYDIFSNTFNQSAASAFTGNNAINFSNAVIPISLSPNLKITDNKVYKINKAIEVIAFNNPRIIDNIITLPSTLTPPILYYAIRTQNCLQELIQSNTISKTGSNPTSSLENFVYGITVETNNSFAVVTENLAQKMGRGLRFYNYSLANTTVSCNVMTKNWAGLTLDAVNIGPQGSSAASSPPFGIANDNNWSTIPGSMVGSFFVKGLGGYTVSNFYVRSLSLPWRPILANIFPSGTILVPVTLVDPLLVSSAPATCPNICYVPPCLHSPMAKIARKDNPFNLVTGDELFLMDQSLLKAILADTTLTDTTDTDVIDLINFRNATLATEMGKIAIVSDSIGSGDTTFAKMLNATIVPSRCAEEYHKIVNEIFLRSWARNRFFQTPTDTIILDSIAKQSPALCGTAVYDARVMIGIDINDYSEESTPKSFEQGMSDPQIVGNLYPNPANTACTYETELLENESGMLNLFDVNGKMLGSYKLNSGYNKLDIDLTPYQSGVYIFKIYFNAELRDVKRLIISK